MMSFKPVLVALVVMAAVAIPLVLSLVPPNDWYGVRTAAAMRDAGTWYFVNQRAGIALLVGSIAGIALLLFAGGGGKPSIAFLAVSIPVVFVAGAVARMKAF